MCMLRGGAVDLYTHNMFQAAPRSTVRYAIILLVFLVVLFQLWKLKTFFIARKESAHQVYVDVGKNNGILIRTNRIISSGRTFRLNSDTDSIVRVHQDGYELHSSAGQSFQEVKNVKSRAVSLVFGHGNAVKTYQSIMEAPWVPMLQDLLKKIQLPIADTISTTHQNLPSQNQVTVVVSNSNYTLSLLNWLVSAQIKTSPPLASVIVISLDKTLQTLLDNKGLISVYVDPETVISGQMHTRSSHIWITRCVIYRLLNHWGYDVIAYDTDAIVLKNLQPVLHTHPDSDILASSGIYPFQLGMKWGLTVCMGVILIRSTRSTELLWNSLSQTRNDTLDDQVKLNYALDSCNIEWFSQGRSIGNQAITGNCSKNKLNGLKVTVLPRSMICRKCKKHLNSYYVWHSRTKRGGDMKIKIAISGNTWFLKDSTVMEDGSLRESKESEQLKGHEWLKAISRL